MAEVVDFGTKEKVKLDEDNSVAKFVENLAEFDLDKAHIFIGTSKDTQTIAVLAPKTEDVSGVPDFYVLLDVAKNLLMQAMYEMQGEE